MSLRGCVYSVVFVLLYLCCCVCAVVFVLLCLCCCVCAVVFALLCLLCCVQNFVPPSSHAVVFSIVAFLFMLVSMLWSDFGYTSCFLLLYIHFSHHSFLNFLCCGLFLDIYLSICSIMSNFTINSYLLSLTANYFWTYFSQLPCLCPITCPYLKMIWKNEMKSLRNNPIYNYSANTL